MCNHPHMLIVKETQSGKRNRVLKFRMAPVQNTEVHVSGVSHNIFLILFPRETGFYKIVLCGFISWMQNKWEII